MAEKIAGDKIQGADFDPIANALTGLLRMVGDEGLGNYPWDSPLDKWGRQRSPYNDDYAKRLLEESERAAKAAREANRSGLSWMNNPKFIVQMNYNIEETETEFILTAEVPGVKREDIQIEVEGKILKIKAEKKKVGNGTGSIVFGNVTQTVLLPKNVQTDEVRADLKDGVLTIKFALKEKAPTSVKVIEIS